MTTINLTLAIDDLESVTVVNQFQLLLIEIDYLVV